MKSFVRDIIKDTGLLIGLIIVPIAFLGPGWRTSATYGPQGSFAERHKSVSGETPEPQQDEQRISEWERDIPILRAFEVERGAADSKRSEK